MADGEDFVRRFREAWEEPATRFAELFDQTGTLYQQGMVRAIGKDEIPAHIATIATLISDQRIEVLRWAANGEEVFIEWTSSATLRGQTISWSGASRFTLRKGLILEEVAYFDTFPLRTVGDPSLQRGDMFREAATILREPSNDS